MVGSLAALVATKSELPAYCARSKWGQREYAYEYYDEFFASRRRFVRPPEATLPVRQTPAEGVTGRAAGVGWARKRGAAGISSVNAAQGTEGYGAALSGGGGGAARRTTVGQRTRAGTEADTDTGTGAGTQARRGAQTQART